MTTPCVSVVIPTYRRPVLLARCLRAVFGQRFFRTGMESVEAIVVDDGRDDATRDMVAALQREVPERMVLRYLRAETGRGPAAARNAGWRAAQAPLVAFTDDDTIPEPGWLSAGVAAMAAAPSWNAAAGAVRVPPSATPPTDHERMTHGLETAEFVTANAFVRTRALRAVQGFDERFLRAWREDADLQFRLLPLGPVGRVNDAVVIHPVREERWGVCLRQQRNTFFDALLYKKHPTLYRERIRPVPPWDYYVIVLLTLALLWLLAAREWAVACAFGAVVLALILRFALRRLHGTARTASHVAEMLLTSALIPFLSVYWRLRGAWRFKVVFL